MSKHLNILIIGAGGREHALAWKAAQSLQVQRVWVAPGNAGTALENKVENIPLAVDDVSGLLNFARRQAVDLVIVGPEAALAAGITDQLQAAGIACFGPTQALAQLETSKIFSKQLMEKLGIPTARYATFADKNAALAYARLQPLPLVIKADGLAAGKGVIIADTWQEVETAIHSMLEAKIFGEAGCRIVIEEFLAGTEMSYIVMSDGRHILPLASSKDHKRRDDHDQGPNTGGMGAYSPAPQITPALEQRVIQEVIEPVIQHFAEQGSPYCGFLYAGLMITAEGNPKVLEFNCRLGDPETQPILMRLQSDLIELCLAAVHGELQRVKPVWDSRPALAVILAAAGYPEVYKTGENIPGVFTATATACKIFHAATKQVDHQVVSNGGRVLAVTALGEDLSAARKQAYEVVKKVAWPECHYRTDIGKIYSPCE
jgi:phosphoribosylamine---glycine ligase